MAPAAALMEPSFDADKLSYEIFSILESKFLFGYDDPKLFLAGSPPQTPLKKASAAAAAGKVRILSIDGGGDGVLAGASLTRLESALIKLSGDPATRIADFFDLAAGSGAGGVLAALLFTRGQDGQPMFSADEALQFLAKNRRGLMQSRGIFCGLLRRSGGSGIFRRVFADATLKDTVKPVLIPCYDLATGAPFMFSRADAVEADGYDFLIREVCAATCAADRAVAMRSVDGRTRIRAVGGALATANPTAAAITHVLNNKQEFPFADGVEDLLVVSLGGGEEAGFAGNQPPPQSAAELVRIAGESAADMVDQSVAMAFGRNTTTNYVRIQASGGLKSGAAEAEAALSQRGVEAVLFRGKRVAEETNGEKLERFAGELIREHERRKRSAVPTVLIKGAVTPRTSSATTSTTITVTSTATSTSTSL